MAAATPAPTKQLTTFRGWSATALYFTDNGAIYCGTHLGVTARVTGRDLSGQRVARVTDDDRAAMLSEYGSRCACEACPASHR